MVFRRTKEVLLSNTCFDRSQDLLLLNPFDGYLLTQQETQQPIERISFRVSLVVPTPSFLQRWALCFLLPFRCSEQLGFPGVTTQFLKVQYFLSSIGFPSDNRSALPSGRLNDCRRHLTIPMTIQLTVRRYHGLLLWH